MSVIIIIDNLKIEMVVDVVDLVFLVEFEFIEFEEFEVILSVLLLFFYIFVGESEDIFLINFVVIENVVGE